MALLPEELSGSDEGSGVLELPSHNVGPLVQFYRKVSVTLDPVGVGRVHDRLACGSDSNGLSKVRLTRFGNPGDLRSKPFNVVLLYLQRLFGNKHGEVGVLDSVCLDELVEEDLNFLPDRVGPGSQNVATRDIVVLDKSRLDDNFLVPSREVSILLGLNSQKVDFFLLFGLFLGLLLGSLFLLNGLKKVETFVFDSVVSEELDDFLVGKFDGRSVIHGVEGPEFRLEELILHN